MAAVFIVPVPDGPVPGGCVPRGTVLRGTGCVPHGTVLRGTGCLPSGTVLRGTVPGGTVPCGTVPGETIPVGTVPGGTVLGGKVPGGTIPGGTSRGSAPSDVTGSDRFTACESLKVKFKVRIEGRGDAAIGWNDAPVLRAPVSGNGRITSGLGRSGARPVDDRKQRRTGSRSGETLDAAARNESLLDVRRLLLAAGELGLVRVLTLEDPDVVVTFGGGTAGTDGEHRWPVGGTGAVEGPRFLNWNGARSGKST